MACGDLTSLTRQIHQTHQANRVVNKNKMYGRWCTARTKMRSTLVCGSGAGLYVMDRTLFAGAQGSVLSRYTRYGRGHEKTVEARRELFGIHWQDWTGTPAESATPSGA